MTNPLTISQTELVGHAGDGHFEELPSQGEIDRTVRKLLARRRPLPGWLASGQVQREDVLDVVVAAVDRVLANPEGFRSESEGTYSYQVNPVVASGYIWFTDEDLSQVTPSAPSVRSARVTPSRPWAGF